MTRADQHRRIAASLVKTYAADLYRAAQSRRRPAVTPEMNLQAGIELELEKAFRRGRSRS